MRAGRHAVPVQKSGSTTGNTLRTAPYTAATQVCEAWMREYRRTKRTADETAMDPVITTCLALLREREPTQQSELTDSADHGSSNNHASPERKQRRARRKNNATIVAAENLPTTPSARNNIVTSAKNNSAAFQSYTNRHAAEDDKLLRTFALNSFTCSGVEIFEATLAWAFQATSRNGFQCDLAIAYGILCTSNAPLMNVAHWLYLFGEAVWRLKGGVAIEGATRAATRGSSVGTVNGAGVATISRTVAVTASQSTQCSECCCMGCVQRRFWAAVEGLQKVGVVSVPVLKRDIRSGATKDGTGSNAGSSSTQKRSRGGAGKVSTDDVCATVQKHFLNKLPPAFKLPSGLFVRKYVFSRFCVF